MVVFNTNQARHLYVATNVSKIADADVVSDVTSGMANGDLKVGAIKNGGAYEDLYFVYKNGDGIVTRSDAIKIKNIEYMNWRSSSDMATTLYKYTVTRNNNVNSVNDLKGKTIELTVTLREFIGLEDSENYPIVVTYDVPSNATDTIIYGGLKTELESAIAAFKTAPFTVDSDSSGLYISQCAQKWVRGKNSADPIHFDIYTSKPITGEAWGTVSDPSSDGTISGDFKIADLEYFTHRERADILGETAWPYDYGWTPLINPVVTTGSGSGSGSGANVGYGLLTIQFFYAGVAEDIQKSPRTIHIAVTDANYSTLSGYIDDFMSPTTASGSGSGSGA